MSLPGLNKYARMAGQGQSGSSRTRALAHRLGLRSEERPLWIRRDHLTGGDKFADVGRPPRPSQADRLPKWDGVGPKVRIANAWALTGYDLELVDGAPSGATKASSALAARAIRRVALSGRGGDG
jgi:hypothetical protein